MSGHLTGQTVELLQAMIRNQCVNEGTMESGEEFRNAQLLAGYLDGAGVDYQMFEAAPGRTSLVARIEGSDPTAPSLCLNGHTDVVPVNRAGWTHDPFGGELIDGEVWGRGAVDMLNLTASMAVAFRHLAASRFRPTGDLVYFAVADEESGSAFGARWMAVNHPEVITTDFVLTESGGLHGGTAAAPTVGIRVGEKGVAWRRLTVRGTPGHGSRPFKSDNAIVKAAAVVQRLAAYSPAPSFHDLWKEEVAQMRLTGEQKAHLLDAGAIDDILETLPAGQAGHIHACTHTTFSTNVLNSQTKTNIIPDKVVMDIDIRTVPGEGPEEVQAHLEAALGPELAAEIEVEALMNDRATISGTDNALFESLQRAVNNPFPEASLKAGLTVGFTDARVHRDLGAIAYGAGLFSQSLSAADYGTRFHGNDERIDVESLSLTTQLWLDVVQDLLG
ncbi:MAG: M20/M25/M40 family metallo-hydrolase [bacterium]|nr:M20/M25/M40 family metallo-hydrolase [bacterium]